MHKRIAVVFLALTSLIAAGCSGGDDEGASPDRQAGGDAGSWTVLHYSMADTDLEPFMVGDVNEMGEVGSQEGLNLRAFVDRSADYGDDELLDQGAWVGARVLDVNQGSAELVEDLGDVNSADPTTLATFIAEGLAAHPADNYSVIISDHGAAWPGIGPDEGSDNDVLDLAQIVEGISSGLEEAGIEKLDLLGFDACLMGSYEVASAVAPLADRLIASQELEPGHGWDYGALQVAADGGTVDEFGTAIVEGFKAQAEEAGTDSEITLSLVDLTAMGAVDEAMTAFSDALVERGAAVAPVVGRANAEVLEFAKGPDETESSHMKDLGQLASAIGVEALDVSDESDALVKALNDAVITSVEGPSTQGATGLSIYFPPTQELSTATYTEVGSAAEWTEFLVSFYTAGEAIPEELKPAFTADQAQVTFDEDGANVTGDFDPNSQGNLSGASISYALVNDDGSLTYIGEEEGEVDPDGAPSASGFYDLTMLKISDGEDEATAYVSLAFDKTAEDAPETFTIDVPMAYFAPEDVDGETYQDVLLSITVESESGDVVNEVYYTYDEASETYGELTPDPEGIIVPEVLTYTAEGEEEWTATSDVGLFAELENLQYDFEKLESGTNLQIDLTVFDYGDNSDTVSARVQIP